MKNSRFKLVAVLLLTLVLLELLLWAFLRQGREPVVSESYKQEVAGLKSSVTYKKNGLGLRTTNLYNLKKVENTIRIICIGLSTTEQATQSAEDMWSGILGAKLNEKYKEQNIKFEVGAYAKGGLKMHEMMRWANHGLLELEPDIVISLFGINSLVTDQVFVKAGWNRQQIESFVTSKESIWPTQLSKFSQLARHWNAYSSGKERRDYVKQTDGYNFDLRGLHGKQRYWTLPLVNELSSGSARYDFFKEKTDLFLSFLQANRVHPIVLGQPLLLHSDMDYQMNGESLALLKPKSNQVENEKTIKELQSLWFPINDGGKVVKLLPSKFRAVMAQYNEVQKEVAESKQVTYVPLDELVEPNLNNFFDDCHFTDQGSLKVAEAIFPYVVKEIENKNLTSIALDQ